MWTRARLPEQVAEIGEQSNMATAQTTPPSFKIYTSPDFPDWLAEQDVSLAFTTYDTGKLFLAGRNPDNQLAVFERTFERAMGLAAPNSNTLWLATSYQLWRFEDCLAQGQIQNTFDRLFVPRAGFTTGDVDIHDVAVDAKGDVVFVCTRFCCLATLDSAHNFRSVWKPPFITCVAPEDRCHLNGMAMQDGVPRYVTVVAETDTPDGWRDHRACGGCVIDVREDAIISRGLSMPHSPRVWRDKLWLLDSGNGQLGYIDDGNFKPIVGIPGYGRGLSFVGKYAIVGVSRPRRQNVFEGLPLDDVLKERRTESMAGIAVVDMDQGVIVHWLKLDGSIRELYDVAALHNVVRPKALGFKDDEIRYTVTDASQPGTIWRGVPE